MTKRSRPIIISNDCQTVNQWQKVGAYVSLKDQAKDWRCAKFGQKSDCSIRTLYMAYLLQLSWPVPDLYLWLLVMMLVLANIHGLSIISTIQPSPTDLPLDLP